MSAARPFLSILTHTYKRPEALARCLASVEAQTAAREIQHLVAVDHVGIGIAGVYAEMPRYREALIGHYVLILNDDNVLAEPTAVERLIDWFDDERELHEVLLIPVELDGQVFPINDLIPKIGPMQSYIDLANLVVHGDLWRKQCEYYGRRYEGDFDFALRLWELGAHFANVPGPPFVIGHASHGAKE